jgi:hypothetical protein
LEGVSVDEALRWTKQWLTKRVSRKEHTSLAELFQEHQNNILGTEPDRLFASSARVRKIEGGAAPQSFTSGLGGRRCFACKGPHLIKDCKNKKKLEEHEKRRQERAGRQSQPEGVDQYLRRD